MKVTDHGRERWQQPGARVFVLVLQADGRREVAEVEGVTVQVDAEYSDGVGAGGPWWQDAPVYLTRRRLTLRGDLREWRADVPEPEKRGLPKPLPGIEA